MGVSGGADSISALTNGHYVVLVPFLGHVTDFDGYTMISYDGNVTNFNGYSMIRYHVNGHIYNRYQWSTPIFSQQLKRGLSFAER